MFNTHNIHHIQKNIDILLGNMVTWRIDFPWGNLLKNFSPVTKFRHSMLVMFVTSSNLIYTCARLFKPMHIQLYIYIYIAIKSKCRCTKIHVPYMSYVYKITLPAPFHWTNLPENLVAPITASLPPQWVQHASSPATLQKPQLVKLLTWIDVRITLIFEQLWIYWWKNECIMMNMKTLAATPPRNIYRLFLIKAPSLKKERANLLSTFQLLFVPIPVFGTWRCGQSQKTRTLLIRMSFPAGNPDRKILKGTCPPRLVGKWVSFL